MFITIDGYHVNVCNITYYHVVDNKVRIHFVGNDYVDINCGTIMKAAELEIQLNNYFNKKGENNG